MSPRNPLHVPVGPYPSAPPDTDDEDFPDVTDDREPDYDDPEYNGRYGPRPTYW